MPRFTQGILIALAALVLDQWTKIWVFDYLDQIGRPVEVLPIFNLVQVYNRGISFGLFDEHNDSRVIFGVFGSVISVILTVWLWRSQGKILMIGLGLIIGGAIGNIIDRIRIGAVLDFLDFHLMGYHWPAFNIADSVIFIGAVCLGIDALLDSKYSKKQP